jgi:S1-C subfamily serine protease
LLVAHLRAVAARGDPLPPALLALGPAAALLRAVKPAIVRIYGDGAGTGVNLAPEGRVLTNVHVPERLGAELWVEFPDGSRYRGVCVRLDARRDLAELALANALALPTAALAAAPPVVGDTFVLVGHPGGSTGDPPPFRVIEGELLGLRTPRDGLQALGAAAHDAPTAEGHSGSPLFDAAGGIIALHNSYNGRSGMRQTASWEALRAFLADPQGVAD